MIAWGESTKVLFMSDKPLTLLINFTPRVYDPVVASSEKPPKSASIIVDSMVAVATRWKACTEPKPTHVLVNCPELVRFVGGNNARVLEWLPGTLRNNLGDNFVITTHTLYVPRHEYDEWFSGTAGYWTGDAIPPWRGGLTFICLTIQVPATEQAS